MPFCLKYFDQMAVTFFFNAAAGLNLFLIDLSSENTLQINDFLRLRLPAEEKI